MVIYKDIIYINLLSKGITYSKIQALNWANPPNNLDNFTKDYSNIKFLIECCNKVKNINIVFFYSVYMIEMTMQK